MAAGTASLMKFAALLPGAGMPGMALLEAAAGRASRLRPRTSEPGTAETSAPPETFAPRMASKALAAHWREACGEASAAASGASQPAAAGASAASAPRTWWLRTPNAPGASLRLAMGAATRPVTAWGAAALIEEGAAKAGWRAGAGRTAVGMAGVGSIGTAPMWLGRVRAANWEPAAAEPTWEGTGVARGATRARNSWATASVPGEMRRSEEATVTATVFLRASAKVSLIPPNLAGKAVFRKCLRPNFGAFLDPPFSGPMGPRVPGFKVEAPDGGRSAGGLRGPDLRF